MCWEVWRVVLSGIATLAEIETKWDLCDLVDANEALDIQAEMEAEARRQSENKGGMR